MVIWCAFPLLWYNGANQSKERQVLLIPISQIYRWIERANFEVYAKFLAINDSHFCYSTIEINNSSRFRIFIHIQRMWCLSKRSEEHFHIINYNETKQRKNHVQQNLLYPWIYNSIQSLRELWIRNERWGTNEFDSDIFLLIKECLRWRPATLRLRKISIFCDSREEINSKNVASRFSFMEIPDAMKPNKIESKEAYLLH